MLVLIVVIVGRDWVTIRKTRERYIRHSRVPLSEVFHEAYADETEVPGAVEAVSALDISKPTKI